LKLINLLGLLHALLELSKKNDYYGLLGASQTADKNELAKLRRQKTAALHPDHFTKDDSARQQ
jgi:DnaJ-class molecular chaperone